MKEIRSLIALGTFFLLFGCTNEAYFKQINDQYYLEATDVKEDMALGFNDGTNGVGVIAATVFAIGYNQDYIIIKQHPSTFGKQLNKQTTNYYIIPLKQRLTKSIDKNFYGPMSAFQFKIKKQQLNSADLNFTITFKELE